MSTYVCMHMYEHMCVFECVVCVCGQQGEKPQRKAGPYQVVKETKPPMVFIPQETGGNWWTLREGELGLCLTLKTAAQNQAPSPSRTPPLWTPPGTLFYWIALCYSNLF